VTGVGEGRILGGRYRLDDPLGEGGMSVVWRAFDLVLGRPVAVKVRSARFAENDQFRESIRTEAQAAATVSHPNLTSVYDYGESVDEAGHVVPFVVMELLTGRTLAERLADGTPRPRTALRICAGIADGLALAHEHGLVHRDVKPGNIMLTPTGAKLVDFGVAALAGAPEASGPDAMIIGTPSYVAPERLLGGPVLPASDVYSLGVLLFRSLTGQLPWPPGLATHTRAEPPPLPHLEGVRPEIGDLYRRCVDLAPDRRPTMREAATILAAAVGVRPVVADADDEDPLAAVPVGGPDHVDGIAAPVGSGPSRQRRVAVAVAVAAVLAGAVLAGIIVVGNSNGSAPRPPHQADGGVATIPPPGPALTVPPSTGTQPGQPDGTAVAVPGQPFTTGILIADGGDPPAPVTQPGPGGVPTPPTTTDPGPPVAPPASRTFSSAGGSAVVTCSGSLAHLTSWSPAGGYAVQGSPQVGPASTVKIAFRQKQSQFTITAWCVAGEPEGQVTTGPGSNPPAPPTTRRGENGSRGGGQGRRRSQRARDPARRRRLPEDRR
jgi:serine/threonine-protein kinase